MLQGLYGISNEHLTPYDKIFEMLESAIKGGLKIFQFRDKTHTDDEVLDMCSHLVGFCAQNNVLFVMNDRIDLAIAIQAPAIHIGSQDCDLCEARKRFEGKIGVSCYDSLDLALKAQDQGADYVAFGAFFDSKTKPNTKRVSLDILKNAKKMLHIPICAIGGIDDKNVHLLKEAEMVAVIGGLWKGEVNKNAESILRHWEDFSSQL